MTEPIKAGQQFVLKFRVTMFPELTQPYDVCKGEPAKVSQGSPVSVVKDQVGKRRILVKTINKPDRFAWVGVTDLQTAMEWQMEHADEDVQ